MNIKEQLKSLQLTILIKKQSVQMQQYRHRKSQAGTKINLKTQSIQVTSIRIKTAQKMFKEKTACRQILATKQEERSTVKTMYHRHKRARPRQVVDTIQTLSQIAQATMVKINIIS